MKNYWFLFLIAVLYCSCQSKYSKNNEVFNGIFPIQEKVSGKVLDLENIMMTADDLTVTSKYLIIKRRRMARKLNGFYFYVFDKKNNSLISSLGLSGRGPNEFITAEVSKQVEQLYNGHEGIWVLDWNKDMIYLVDLDSSIAENTIVIVREIEDIWRANFSKNLIVADPYIFSNPLDPGGRFAIHDLVEDTTLIIPHYPIFDDAVLGDALYNIYGSDLVVTPDRKTVVSVMTFMDRIDICEINGTLKKSIIREPKEPYDFSNFGSGFDMSYFLDADVSNDHIFALRYNNKLNHETVAQTDMLLEIYTIEGEPVALIDLGEPIKRISFDSSNGMLYANSVKYNENENYQILRYDLAQYLK